MNRSRREILQIGGASMATALTAGFSGCSSVTDMLPGGDGGSTGLSMVPTGVSAVARGNVTKTLNDSAVATFVNTILGQLAQREEYTGATNKSELLDRFSQETGLELSKAKTAVGFLKYPETGTATPEGGQYSGLWFEADWAEDAVVSALESGDLTLSESTYSEKTVYRSTEEFQTGWLGVLGSNTYVVGTETPVKDTIDVSNGDMDSLGGDLKSAYSGTRSAPFKFAASVPENQVPSESRQIGDTSINTGQFAAVNYVTGATYHDGDTVGIKTKMLTGSSDDAEDIKNMIAGGVSAGEGEVQNETLTGALDDISVSQDGSTVLVEVSGPVERATNVIKAAMHLLGIG